MSSSPLVTTPVDPSPQNNEAVAPEFEKKHPVTSSISSLLNGTKPIDGAHGRITSTPSSPKLTVTSSPPTHCGAPEQEQQQQQQQQRKRPFSALDKGGELSISISDDTRPSSLSKYYLDTPQQPQPSSWPSGNHRQHYQHHLPTPVSPAAPMPQHNTQSSEIDSAQRLKEDPKENNDNLHLHPPPSRPKPETSTGMYTSFLVKQPSSTHANNNTTSNGMTSGSATISAGALSPSASSPLKTRSVHESTPTTPKPYTCTECDQTFSRAHNLKSHTATHSLERPYKCESCQAKFRRLHDLKRHQKLHTGERPYICNMCQRSFSRLDALNRHQRTEGGSACHYRQNRRRTEQKHSDSFDEESSSPPPPAAAGPVPADRPFVGPATSSPVPSDSSPTSVLPPGNGSFSSASVASGSTSSTIQQQQQQQTQAHVQTQTQTQTKAQAQAQTQAQTQKQMQPQRPAPSRPNIPQLNLRHRFSSPYHPDDASAPQPLAFRSTPTSSSPMGDDSSRETARRIVLPPPSNSTPTSSTPTQPAPSHLNTFPLHPPPPPPPPPPAATPSPSRSPYPLPPLQDVPLDRIKRRRSSGGGSEHATADTIAAPGTFNGPESYPALHAAYMQLLEQYRVLQTAVNHTSDAKIEEIETLRRKVHDLQVENRVLRSLVFERQQ